MKYGEKFRVKYHLAEEEEAAKNGKKGKGKHEKKNRK